MEKWRVLLLAVVVGLVGLYFGSGNNEEKTDIKVVKKWDENLQKIPRQEWTSKKIAEKFAKSRAPLVFHNTPANNWTAMSQWTPEYFSTVPSKGFKVFQNQKPVFTYFSTSTPMYEYLEKPTHLKETRMKISDFFESFKNTNSFAYFSAHIDDFPSQFSKDVEPTSWMNIDIGSSVKPSKMVWIGMGGVTAQTHYDSLYNFYVQIYGHKKFILFPPNATNSFYLFPNIHPSCRQSQVDFENVDLVKFPKFDGSVQGYEVVLAPGDVLYLPPFWYHRVIAMDLSISFNFWSDSDELVIYYDKLLKIPLPFEKDWNEEQKFFASKIFIDMLTRKLNLFGNGNNNKFIYQLVAQRYQPAFGKAKNDSHICRRFSYQKTDFLDPFLIKFETRSVEIAKVFEEIAAITNEDSVRNIFFGNYIEYIANFFFGAKNVHEFLHYCFL